ncbi:MAG: hypothetical protein J6M26_03085 [Clostridia bacterium]|nr:hypothetical protein [Clostridia bacterium]
MDKYQEYLLNKLGIERWLCIENLQGKKAESTFNFDTGYLTIIQNEDPSLVEYSYLVVNNYDVLSGVSFFKDEEWTEIKRSDFQTDTNCIPSAKIPPRTSFCNINLNFNDRVEEIKLTFKNGLAEDYIIRIAYLEADKQAWARKIEEEQRESLIAAANIKVSTGVNLVNIYFQPCCDSYARTEIALYKDDMMLAKYKVDEEVFFKSINGLAYGKYEFILKQLNTKNETILETDKISFQIVPPTFGMGRHTVVNRI